MAVSCLKEVKEVNNIYTIVNGELSEIGHVVLDEVQKKLIDLEFNNISYINSEATKKLIDRLGFEWDALSSPGYLTFKPYASYMVEATKLHIWRIVRHFCEDNNIPIQRISGGDLYSLRNELMKKHVSLAEKVGMYGEGLLTVNDESVLRFSACSNKLSLLHNTNFEDKKLPFGIFEISDSYRYENEEEIDLLLRNRMFHLPELHIVNENLKDGLGVLLNCDKNMKKNMTSQGLDYILLISTTRKFVTENGWFIDLICSNLTHNPIVNLFEEDTCENGIVFDVEYKAQMSTNSLLEIGTFQIDVGDTGFSYGIRYHESPVTTIHAVFWGSSIERTIYTLCDIAIRDNKPLPEWLTPINYRFILRCNDKMGYMVENLYYTYLREEKVEIDDRDIAFEQKIMEAIELHIPNVLYFDKELMRYSYEERCFVNVGNEDEFFSHVKESSVQLESFSPIKMSQAVL